MNCFKIIASASARLKPTEKTLRTGNLANRRTAANTQKYRFIERAPKEILDATLEAVFSEIEIFGAD